MARILSTPGEVVSPLDRGWSLRLTPAGACGSPEQAAQLDGWIPAQVPGTVASALREAGLWTTEAPKPLHDQDAWYRTEVNAYGRHILRFEGLATLAEVWLGEQLILTSDSMFLAHEVEVELSGEETLWLCLRALAPRLEQKGPRARWRPQMITPQGVRLVRTTLLGHMPGWCPPVDAVGPWRPVWLIQPAPLRVVRADVRASLEPTGAGRLVAQVKFDPGVTRVEIECDGRRSILAAQGDGTFSGQLDLPDVDPWWPHTHGSQPLYPVTLHADGAAFDLGRTGFRRIEADPGADGLGFGLRVNGEPVFCRGACWTTADLVGLSGERFAYEPVLRLACEAGMNMLRIGGTGVYETPAFFDLCDELGVLVWQDFMFANFDYPAADPAFVAAVKAEAGQLLDRIQLSPSLAVLCGGSEVQQQAAMMGLPAKAWSSAICDEVLPAIAEAYRPDVPYVPGSPSGGELPFAPNRGVAHYYGVGAYLRPLEDARRAEVRFAAECLAFANVPQPSTLARDLPGTAAVHDPRWKAGVPRDRGASWDFEDVRDHYLGLLYVVDPVTLRREDPALYLDLSRAVTGEVMEEVFAEWRRAASPCAGGLVWTLQDLRPGAGWGVIDSSGEPKPAWYALKRAFRPVQVSLTDEGCNGLAIQLHNETPSAVQAVLRLQCLREGSAPVISVEQDVELAPRSSRDLSAYGLIGTFFDISYAYRFGPPSYDVTVAELADAGSGEVLARAFHFPLGRGVARPAPQVEAQVESSEEGFTLVLRSDRLAQLVHIEDANFRGEDDGFHLAPHRPRRVRLVRRAGAPADARPAGEVRTPGGASVTPYAAAD